MYINSKKRKPDTVNKNANTNQNEPLTNHVTTYNRFEILESTDDCMNVVETLTNQHTQKVPPPLPIFIDDVIDIQIMIKSIEKDINKEDYKLKTKNNQIKILSTNPDFYIKLTKLLKTLNANFHTYQLKQERPSRGTTQHLPFS